jgi:hypothetical protein
MRHSQRLIYFGLALAVLRGLTGCSSSPKDAATMKQMAGQISSAISNKLAAADYHEAVNLSLASCVFAREVNAAAAKEPMNPTPDLAMKLPAPTSEEKASIVIMGGGPVAVAAIREMVQKTAFQANKEVEGLTTNTYDELLATAVSKENIARLMEIRERKAYWSKVAQTIK